MADLAKTGILNGIEGIRNGVGEKPFTPKVEGTLKVTK